MTIHVATSADLGEAVRRGLGCPVAFLSDNLLVGPCALDPEAHCQQRIDFWGLRGRERGRFLASFREVLTAIDSPEEVSLWTSHLWSDTVALRALCSWRLRRSRALPDLAVVVLGDTPGPEDASGFGRGSIHVTPADARRALARPLSPTSARRMALEWRKLAARSPLLSAQATPAGTDRREWMDLGAYQAGFFPRQGAEGLLLSRFDELLFACIEERGSTPVEVFVHRSAAGDELRRWLPLTGDVFLAMRLRQWAAHGGDGAALESVPEQADNLMKAARYRLSDAGKAIRRHGLAEIARGAPLPVWGAVAYDPRARWVVVEEHAGRPTLAQLGVPGSSRQGQGGR